MTDLDPALVSRFNLYEFAPSLEDWLLWAHRQQRVIAFIQKHPEYLDSQIPKAEEAWRASGLMKTPDRRAWARVSDFVLSHQSLGELEIKAIAGLVGSPAALAFRQSIQHKLRITAQQLLLQFERHRAQLKEMSLQELVLLNEQIFYWLNLQNLENFLAYLKTLKQLKQLEVLAHLASQLENPNFQQATGILALSLEIVQFLTTYIQGIEV